MDNTVGLLSALGADCWTGREFVQPRLNPRWARVFRMGGHAQPGRGDLALIGIFDRNALQ